MSIKNILKNANRYEDTLKILDTIAAMNGTSYPVEAFVDEDNITRWRIDGKDLRKEAKLCKQIVMSDTTTDTNYSLSNIFQYVHSYTNMLLHNYANSLAHRNIPNDNLNTIRAWLVVGSVIDHCDTNYKTMYDNCNDSLSNDLIPNGWKKLDNDTEDLQL